jgi:hypothetical protein
MYKLWKLCKCNVSELNNGFKFLRWIFSSGLSGKKQKDNGLKIFYKCTAAFD